MRLAFFFTEGVSLDVWYNKGMFDREIKPYNKLAEEFEEILFFTYGDKKDLKYNKFLKKNITVIPNKTFLPSKLYSILIPIIHFNQIRNVDILKTNQMQGAWTAVIAKLLYKKRLVLRCGYIWSQSTIGWNLGYLKFKIVNLIERVSYNFADIIILTTLQAKDYVFKKYHINLNKIKVIPNYIDVDLFKPVKIEKMEKHLIYVGRLERDKNLISLLKAMIGLDVVLDIFGTGSKYIELKEYAEKNKLEVNFFGSITNNSLPIELNKRNIFVLPSLYEGNPKALLEAMACGLAVIGNDVRGVNNIIKHGENGFLSKGDVFSINSAIKILLNNSGLVEEIGEQARKYVVENCNLEHCIQSEFLIYKSLLLT